jgi:hypothetical protein
VSSNLVHVVNCSFHWELVFISVHWNVEKKIAGRESQGAWRQD